MVFSAGRNPLGGWTPTRFWGSVLAGWGIFNFVEGLIDHQILGIHHVLPGHPNEFLFDMLFLASGIALALIGYLLCRRSGDPASPNP
jgi:uncharacterized membrane protein